MDKHQYYQLQYDIHSKLKEIYIQYIKKYIFENKIDSVKELLNLMYVPDEIITIKVLENASSDIIQLIYKSKQELDLFTSQVLNVFKNFNKEIELVDIETNLKCLDCKYSDNYKIFLVQHILYSDINDAMRNMHVLNTLKNYKNTWYLFNKLICDGAYYANHRLLTICLHLLEENENTPYRFEPLSKQSHKDIATWLLKNISRSEEGKYVGWRSGPDSGVWPSSCPEDYVLTYNLYKSYVKL